MKNLSTLVVLFLFLCCTSSSSFAVHAKQIEGDVQVNSDFIYIDHYVFSPNGTLNYTVNSKDPHANNFKIAMYNDVDRSIWKRVYENKDHLDCYQRVALANGLAPLAISTPTVIDFYIEYAVETHEYWIVIANCGFSSTKFDYEMTFLYSADDHDDDDLVGHIITDQIQKEIKNN
eukprot:TRINITY_DN1256_c0_g1_i1.p1 TRINITY_DN1256_c0_g1~~TRINITY_DN1256_c0_g1_i1.p1  ORF type:complete len:175 (-),score=23.62 TRINITY_DN1256_c0_g1_i1:89-613(-)